MTLECLTPCECSLPGWCERHLTFKGRRAHRLCQRSLDTFQQWEAKKTGQLASLEAAPAMGGGPPGTVTLAGRLLKATFRYVTLGCPQVSDEVYEQRIAICQGCPRCDLTRLVCTQKSCGCSLTRKARWQTEDCPEGLWPSVLE